VSRAIWTTAAPGETIVGMTIRWLTIFLDRPSAGFDAEMAFWQEVTGSALSPARGGRSEFATLLPPAGDAYLRVQRTVDGSGSHLDLHLDPAEESLATAAARAVTLGARQLRHEDGLVVLASPGGFTFCLVRWQGENLVPDPIDLGKGGANRLDQLCLDIPPEVYDGECSFWTAFTGWPLTHRSGSEFSVLTRPAGLPVRILLQRRDIAEPGDNVSAHVDFACSDFGALADRHLAAGAHRTETFGNWQAMADPGGAAYCLTARNPRTGQLD
jgi:hypothetical protein